MSKFSFTYLKIIGDIFWTFVSVCPGDSLDLHKFDGKPKYVLLLLFETHLDWNVAK